MRKLVNPDKTITWECSYCDGLARDKQIMARHERIRHPESRDK